MNVAKAILVTVSLILAACGGSGSGGSSTHNAAPSLITSVPFETNDMILNVVGFDYPGASELTITNKNNGSADGIGNCDGRVQLYDSTIVIYDFIGSCAKFNGTYTFQIKTKCVGYSQLYVRCGIDTHLDIVLKRQ